MKDYLFTYAACNAADKGIIIVIFISIGAFNPRGERYRPAHIGIEYGAGVCAVAVNMVKKAEAENVIIIGTTVLNEV